jgi:hypothetical protein
MRAPRLPENILIVVAGGAFLFSLIAGGVAVSQAMGGAGWRAADWSWFLGCLGVVAACFLLRISGLVDWIGEDELEELAAAEPPGFLERHGRLILPLIVLVYFVEFLHEHFGDRFLNLNAHLPNGDTGATLCGFTLGYFHVFGRTITGAEIAFVGPLVLWLFWMLRGEFSRLMRANQR